MPFYSFVFTGKERDEETGYGYFGARYMDHELMTMWLSVDPMADKYPSISPYAYCAWNPVKLVDPDGKEIDDYFSESGKYLGSDNATTNNVRIIGEYAWKNLPKDDKGRIEHELGNIVSKSFSEASEGGLSKKAQINIYNYYNPTKYSISAKAKESEDTKTGGMATVVGYENKKTTIRIEIYLKGNINTKTCDNADEIINSFIHEKNHIEKAEQVGYHKYVEMRKSNRYELESSAVAAQKSHPSWNGTSKVYKERVNNYLESFKIK